MKIYGLQKTTLLDYPGKVACTIFTGGCNLRCPFCHNSSLVLNPSQEIDNDEFFDFLKKRKGILDGVCVTGGEPLLQDDIEEMLKSIKALGYLVKLDTNGTFPEKLKQIVNDGCVDYVAMDIKNSLDSYPKTVGFKNYNTKNVEESVKFLLEDNIDYEFRTTVVKQLHTENDMRKIANWIYGCKRYFLQCFKDSGDILSEGMSAYSVEELEKFKNILMEKLKFVEIRGIDEN